MALIFTVNGYCFACDRNYRIYFKVDVYDQDRLNNAYLLKEIMAIVILEEKLRERLRAALVSPAAKDIEYEVAVTETIKYYYPDLGDRELLLCVELIFVLWDGAGLRSMDELIARQLNRSVDKHHLFSTEEQVRCTIADLEKKNIIWEKTTNLGIKITGFVRREVEDQALKAMVDASCKETRRFI